MQFSEELPDRQAADAVRGRIDWKDALGLELSDSGFDFSVLSEFRSRLIEGHAESLLFETMLLSLRQRGLLKAGGQQRTDATQFCEAHDAQAIASAFAAFKDTEQAKVVRELEEASHDETESGENIHCS